MSQRIPFDSVVLAAITHELQRLVGARVQGIRQPTPTEVTLETYGKGQDAMLLLSCHPLFARAHLVSRRGPNAPTPPAFCAALRSRLEGGQIVAVRQIGLDRILEIDVASTKGNHVLVAEIMGKHSNLVLLDSEARIVAAAKHVGSSKSSRPILPGHLYELPPVLGDKSLLDAGPDDDPKQLDGASPFLRRLIGNIGLAEVQERLRKSEFGAFYVPRFGAYPWSVSSLGYSEIERGSLSQAVEQSFGEFIANDEMAAIRGLLLAGLKRVLAARDRSLLELRQAQEAGGKAPLLQRQAELLLAYGPSSPPGTSSVVAWDYDGSEITITVDPELDYRANAQKLFEKAKKAKGRMAMVAEQLERIGTDRASIVAALRSIEEANSVRELLELREECRAHRWLTEQKPVASKEDRPFGGYRVRELLGPDGVTVLYGENAESNDYLTTRVAKPNDTWLHVRGNVSAHVVIRSGNKSETLSKEVLLFAAKVAVRNSPTKHSGYVAVDYTLKRYVRKPKGAPPGTVEYTHEKTLHVEP